MGGVMILALLTTMMTAHAACPWAHESHLDPDASIGHVRVAGERYDVAGREDREAFRRVLSACGADRTTLDDFDRWRRRRQTVNACVVGLVALPLDVVLGPVCLVAAISTARPAGDVETGIREIEAELALANRVRDAELDAMLGDGPATTGSSAAPAGAYRLAETLFADVGRPKSEGAAWDADVALLWRYVTERGADGASLTEAFHRGADSVGADAPLEQVLAVGFAE